MSGWTTLGRWPHRRAAAGLSLDLVADESVVGLFRADLYYRLNVVTIAMPPLRDRKEDVQALTQFFVRRFSGELKKKVAGFDTEAMKLLMRYNWPGNIRELENVVERAVLLTDSTTVGLADLQIGDQQSSSSAEKAPAIRIPPTGIPLEEIERQAVLEAVPPGTKEVNSKALAKGLSLDPAEWRLQG